MAQSKKSVKVSPKNSKNMEVNPASKKINKIKVKTTKQPKSDIAIEKKAKKMKISEKSKKDEMKLQYSIDSSKPQETSSSMKIYFPNQFSMLKNMEFLDHISDAENIIFDNSVYAVCQDVSTAEVVRLTANGLRFQEGKNFILRADRLGPAFCAFKRKEVDPTVLTIKKLPVGLKYDDLLCRFPGVMDICLKKTMAKLKFSNADNCKLAWLRIKNIVWPQGAVPTVDQLPKDSAAVTQDEAVDPEEIKFGHPNKLVENPCVVFLRLKNRFELTKGMEVLDVLKIATDIILSKSCTVVFPTFKEALKRRQLLAGHSVAGGDVVTWMSGRPHHDHTDKKGRKQSKKGITTEPEADSSQDEEEAESSEDEEETVGEEEAQSSEDEEEAVGEEEADSSEDEEEAEGEEKADSSEDEEEAEGEEEADSSDEEESVIAQPENESSEEEEDDDEEEMEESSEEEEPPMAPPAKKMKKEKTK